MAEHLFFQLRDGLAEVLRRDVGVRRILLRDTGLAPSAPGAVIVGAFHDDGGRRITRWEVADEVPATPVPSSAVREQLDRVETALTELQHVMIDLAEKMDRRMPRP